MQRIKLLLMQEYSQEHSQVVDMVPVPSIGINVADVVVGDIGLTSVLPQVGEDEDK